MEVQFKMGCDFYFTAFPVPAPIPGFRDGMICQGTSSENSRRKGESE